MKYISTRGNFQGVEAAEAIRTGMVPAGGLFVPEEIPVFSLQEIREMAGKKYQEIALQVLERFLTDYSREELNDSIQGAYERRKFPPTEVVPVIGLTDNLYLMELWHGPTAAFKDMALQLMPRLLMRAIKKAELKKEIVILVATSGDTGSAALEGFKDLEGVKIIVFYPAEGVSEIQELQMTTVDGKNTYVVGVKGNFDDCQSAVKAIFADQDLKDLMAANAYQFSSANSINWGRLVPQIVYYFSAYAELLKNKSIRSGDKINFVVPTGNFGNILAAWYAMSMGLPVNRLICASNENNVLTDFIISGTYDRRREFHKTLSPSMDILISSNLERLLYELSGKDSGLIRGYMNDLIEKGFYTVNDSIREQIQSKFWAGFSSDRETIECIRSVYQDYGYVLDTHTAVAMDVYDKYVIYTGDLTPTVIVSTASPFKFNQSVAKALFEDEAEGLDEFELLKLLSEKTGWEIPVGLKDLDKREIIHKTVCDKDKMGDIVMHFLNV